MKNEKSIIFGEDMIKAIKNTKPGVWPADPIDQEKPFKGMTRRVIKPQPYIIQKADPGYIDVWGWEFAKNDGMHWTEVSLPRKQEEICEHSKYKIGDLLWVREAYQIFPVFEVDGGYEAGYEYEKIPKERPSNCCITYRSTDDGEKWRTPMFMPRWASRFLLEVKSIKVERVQQITNEDVKKEGIKPCGLNGGKNGFVPAFMLRWDDINKKRGYGWVKNPWVYVIEFMRVK